MLDINLGNKSKSVVVLIEKISDAVGGMFKSHQIIRIAKAEAEANIIQTKTDIEIGNLKYRALNRFAEEEAKKQINMEGIIEKSIPS